MKFTLSWLKEYLDTTASLEEICNKLTEIGLEVESVEDKGKSLEDFKVAKIISADPVENSNKLQICQVQTFNSEKPLQVICGAKNARANLKIAFAPIGSIIPSNQMRIKKAKLAGLESNGMICSGSELNISSDAEGIIEIPEEFQIGTPISTVFNLSDPIIEVNVTPNRGDCLGVYGIARDLAATNIGSLKTLNIPTPQTTYPFPIEIINNAGKSCGKTSFCLIKNIKNQQSPDWLKERLEAIGMNSISAIVDVTNYIMVCLNRPMHAYDFNKLTGNIHITFAKNQDKFTSLKEIKYELNDKTLMVADDEKYIGIAGVMGSLNSTSDLDTTDILLESAFFSPEDVATSGRKLNILSDSRYRFERGIDENSSTIGIHLACQLITEICGGQISEIKTINDQVESKTISFDPKKIAKLTGIEISISEIKEIVTKLQFNISSKDDLLNITIPTHRHDISCSQDIIEEVIRIYGYDKLGTKIIPNLDFNHVTKSQNPLSKLLKKTRQHLVANNLFETINWSFINAKYLKNFGYEQEAKLTIQNPISSELNYMRPNLIINLIENYKRNYLKNNPNLSLFEIGNIFNQNQSEQMVISGLRAGQNSNQNHYKTNREFDIFDVKKDLFEITEIFGVNPDNLQYEAAAPRYYHPGRSATLKLGKNIIGHFGEINPKISKDFDIRNRINCFEIFVNNLPSKNKIKSKPLIINDLPEVERDFSFLINEEITIDDLIKTIYKTNRDLISDVTVFDIYHGEKIEKGKKSTALKVKIQ
ncbi:MAG: phenylalanine--tRNA ligase subunit beta, partial [Rickettsiales bacterium]|nr:phenylalanine--tRNA ligase subunit beta [Rickettsiales bacterium]